MSSDEEDVDIPVGGFDELAGGDCSQFPYMQYPEGSAIHRRFCRIRTRRLGQQKALSWATLETVGEAERARFYIGQDTPFDRLFDLAAQPSHRTMMVEFLSTFLYRPRPDDQPDSDMDDPDHPLPPEVSFCLFGQRFDMSLRQWAIATGLFHEPETVHDIYTTAVHTLPDDTLAAWWPTIGRGVFVRKARVKRIRDPLIRYIHRCIATSIAARGKSNEWVTKPDLFYLYCLFTGRPCALHRCLAEYFAGYYHRQHRGRLYGGAYITTIARSVNRYLPYVHDIPPPAPPFLLDLPTLRGMRIVGTFPQGPRLVDDDGHIWVPVPLVHQPELHAQPVQMPHVAEPQPGAPQGQPEVEVDPPHDSPQEPQDQPQDPPQHPQRVYHAVRLPASVTALLERVVAGQETTIQLLTQHGRRIDRLEDCMEWLMESERHRYIAAGQIPRADPPRRVYPDDGPSGSQPGPSGTQPGPSVTEPGPSRTQPDDSDRTFDYFM